MATLSIERTLYRNIEADLKNLARYSDIKVFQSRVVLAPLPFPAFNKAPYIVITPAVEAGDAFRDESRDLEINVWVVSFIAKNYRSQELKGGALIDDSGTLIRAVRSTLVRPEPYRDSVFASAPYEGTQADRDAVITCLHVQTGPFESLVQPRQDPEEEELIEDLHLARAARLRYEMIEV